MVSLMHEVVNSKNASAIRLLKSNPDFFMDQALGIKLFIQPNYLHCMIDLNLLK